MNPSKRTRASSEAGFSLIELLVVILILAVLAAIAVPVFLRQREQGWASQSVSALKDASLAIESYGTRTGGDYSGLDGASSSADNAAYTLLKQEGFKKAPAVDIVVAAPGTTYCITATHQLLDATHNWKIGTYNSTDGSPSTSDVDACV
jgi:type IV pilus assembly protein PilA